MLALNGEALDQIRRHLVDVYASSEASGIACLPGSGPNASGAAVLCPQAHQEPPVRMFLYDGRDFYWWPEGVSGFELMGD